MNKKILLLDFDGVCHSYESGWLGITRIVDPPVDGLFEFLARAADVFEIHVYGSRSCSEEGREAMRLWFERVKGDAVLPKIYFPRDKPPAHVIIDDRAITFRGKWPNIQELNEFEPWNR